MTGTAIERVFWCFLNHGGFCFLQIVSETEQSEGVCAPHERVCRKAHFQGGFLRVEVGTLERIARDNGHHVGFRSSGWTAQEE